MATRPRRSARRQPAPPGQRERRRLPWLLALGLIGLVAVVFGEVRHFPFVDFDDTSYVVDNRHLVTGLTAANVAWAFTTSYEGYWAPILWISYMVDVSFGGLDAGWFHLTNVALHAATTCLLYWVLASTTGARWRSAAVAALFAIHPLHVESVAWVAERKDVLSGLFWMLALAAYVRHVRRPSAGAYLLVALSLAFGLMTKPIVATLPVVLLLLDYWPLDRLAGVAPTERRRTVYALVIEKIPLALLSGVALATTLVTQRGAGAIASLDAVPPATRVGNAVLAYGWYLAKMAWPTGLAALYPYPTSLPIWEVVLSAALLVVVSWWVWRHREHRPFALTGWLWYLCTLVPVLGLVQTGPQARADRYTYLPMIGIALAVVWTAGTLATNERRRRALGVSLALALTALAFAARHQVQFWRDSGALFSRAIAVTSGNYVAEAGFGLFLRDQGRFEEALPHFLEAIRLRPNYAEAHGNLGETLMKLGRHADAVPHLREAVRLKPDAFEFLVDLGTSLDTLRRDGAEAAYRDALRLAPEASSAHAGLGIILARKGELNAATRQLEEAVRLDPGSSEARYNLGLLFARVGRTDEAIAELREAVRLDPSSAIAYLTLGRLLAAEGRYDDAINALTEGVRLEPADARAHDSLGGALLFAGRPQEAAREFETAVRLDPSVPEFRVHLDQARGGTRTR